MSDKPLIPKYFAVQPDEPTRDKYGAVKESPLGHRRRAHSKYENSIAALVKHLDNFEYFDQCGLLDEWAHVNSNRFGDVLAARHEFYHHIATITGTLDHSGDEATARRDSRIVGIDPGAGSIAAVFARLPEESAEEHEYRLFRDFGVRAEKPTESKERTQPLGAAVFLPTDPSVELLTSIRDLLEQLVSAVTPTPTIKFAKIETLLGDDPANRRHTGARFSHPTPPAAPETPDAPQ